MIFFLFVKFCFQFSVCSCVTKYGRICYHFGLVPLGMCNQKWIYFFNFFFNSYGKHWFPVASRADREMLTGRWYGRSDFFSFAYIQLKKKKRKKLWKGMLLNISDTVRRIKLFRSPASAATSPPPPLSRRKINSSLVPRVVASPNREKQDTYLPSFITSHWIAPNPFQIW